MGPAQTVRSMTVRFEDVKVQLYAAKAAKASLESDMAKMDQDLGHHKQDQIKSKRLLQENAQLQKLLDGAKAANKVILDRKCLSRSQFFLCCLVCVKAAPKMSCYWRYGCIFGIHLLLLQASPGLKGSPTSFRLLRLFERSLQRELGAASRGQAWSEDSIDVCLSCAHLLTQSVIGAGCSMHWSDW